MKRRLAWVFVGMGVPAVLFAAPKAPAKKPVKEAPQEEQAVPASGVSEAELKAAQAVVSEEMRAASDAASASAEAAIATLRAAKAALAAERGKAQAGQPTDSQNSQKAPQAALPNPVREAAALSDSAAAALPSVTAKPKAVEKLEIPKNPLPESQPPTAAGKPPTEILPAQASPSPVVEAPEALKAPGAKVEAPMVEAPLGAAKAAEKEGDPSATPVETKKKSRFGGDDVLGDASKKKKGKKEPAVKLSPEEQKAAEIKAFADKAREAIKRGEEEVARTLLEGLVAVALPESEKKVALVEVAKVYEEKGDLTKAIAIHEKLCSIMESDLEMPAWLLKLGQLYRDAGAFQMAISRYYSVIQLSMKVGSSDFQRYQGMTRQAQREIANTYFIKGDFEQAQKFYNMALRSELPKEERAIALFRAAHCTFMRNDLGGAANSLERFLKDFSKHPSAAEARYMLATAYRLQGRPQDAYDTVIDLLRDAKGKSGEDPKAWAFWQKKAGNEFANDYYQRGEFVNAVTIYQSLAAIEASPEWRWPVVYQMGLCFERLRLENRAGECYNYILEESRKPEFRWRKMPQSVANLVQMAGWRSEQLSWEGAVHGKLRTLAGADFSAPNR